jgi:hypothetical protein
VQAFARLPGLLFYNIVYSAMSINDIEKRSRGRPTTGSTPVLVRLPPDELAAIDAWIKKEHDGASRPMAIRRLVEQALDSFGRKKA